jgi:hypothetical protein
MQWNNMAMATKKEAKKKRKRVFGIALWLLLVVLFLFVGLPLLAFLGFFYALFIHPYITFDYQGAEKLLNEIQVYPQSRLIAKTKGAPPDSSPNLRFHYQSDDPFEKIGQFYLTEVKNELVGKNWRLKNISDANHQKSLFFEKDKFIISISLQTCISYPDCPPEKKTVDIAFFAWKPK